MEEFDVPRPRGQLSLQTIAMPNDTNPDGDIFGGWLVSQMDLAAWSTANRLSKGRVVTVAIDAMVFLLPVSVGSLVSCHTDVLSIGRTSMKILVEVWASKPTETEQLKVTEGIFTFVAIDEQRRTRSVPKAD